MDGRRTEDGKIRVKNFPVSRVDVHSGFRNMIINHQKPETTKYDSLGRPSSHYVVQSEVWNFFCCFEFHPSGH